MDRCVVMIPLCAMVRLKIVGPFTKAKLAHLSCVSPCTSVLSKKCTYTLYILSNKCMRYDITHLYFLRCLLTVGFDHVRTVNKLRSPTLGSLLVPSKGYELRTKDRARTKVVFMQSSQYMKVKASPSCTMQWRLMTHPPFTATAPANSSLVNSPANCELLRAPLISPAESDMRDNMFKSGEWKRENGKLTVYNILWTVSTCIHAQNGWLPCQWNITKAQHCPLLEPSLAVANDRK
jgi:hypothetical protein